MDETKNPLDGPEHMWAAIIHTRAYTLRHIQAQWVFSFISDELFFILRFILLWYFISLSSFTLCSLYSYCNVIKMVRSKTHNACSVCLTMSQFHNQKFSHATILFHPEAKIGKHADIMSCRTNGCQGASLALCRGGGGHESIEAVSISLCIVQQ